VELTRNWKSLKTGIMLLVVGMVFLASPSLLALVGREFVLGSWVGYVMGGIGFLGGIFMIVEGAARYRIGVSELGLDLKVPGLTAKVPWQQIDTVVAERDTTVEKNPSVVLVMVPSPGAELPRKPEYQSRHEGRFGIKLIQVDELRDGHNAMASAMHRYAGAKFVDLGA
jgi:hypothetical protein